MHKAAYVGELDTMKPDDTPHVMSYLSVRRMLGLLGLSLPISLYVYARVFGRGMQPSISEFYHTEMGDILVGILVAIGVFLFSYKGYSHKSGELFSDRNVSRTAGVGILIVALFPAAPASSPICSLGQETSTAVTLISGFTGHWCGFEEIHFLGAILFFVCMAVFCFFQFPKGYKKENGKINWKIAENRVYAASGIVIVLSIIALLVYFLAGSDMQISLQKRNYVFWLESIGVIAFAVAWLAKGKSIRGMMNVYDRVRTAR